MKSPKALLLIKHNGVIMNRYIKLIILSFCRGIGTFKLCRFISTHKLRILCYHGFSSGDHSSFRPKLFIKKNTFEKRIKYLVNKKYNFINTSDFCSFLAGENVKDSPVLLTIDDGWKNTNEFALATLKENKIPSIIYLYTDCYEREIPVLNVLLQYAIWKTLLDQISWRSKIFDLKKESDSIALLNIFLSEAETLDKSHLHERLSEIFCVLKVDYSLEKEWKDFSLLNQAEIKEHLLHGGSFQLHTHHHNNPLRDDLLEEELNVNRQIIESVTGQIAVHFCYPSGVYSRENFPLLKKLGIKSAVTCVPGLNDKSTHPYELKRFLDGENITQIEFEAEMSGFLDICRRIFKRGD